MNKLYIEYPCGTGKAIIQIPDGATFRDYYAIRRMIRLYAAQRPWSWRKPSQPMKGECFD